MWDKFCYPSEELVAAFRNENFRDLLFDPR